MHRIQNKLAWVLLTMVTLVLVATLAGVVRGGPLDPPSSPGPTQEELLFQPANCAGFPITINAPGSYKLAQNITMPAGCAKDGIAVNAFNVTLDLQGFEVVGVTGALSGINANQSNLTVRNGTIRDWPANAILGIWGSVIDDVRATRNGTNGIGLGDRSRVTNCLVEDSAGGYGISVGHDSVVDSCIIRGSGGTELIAGDRALIEECTANGLTTAGAQTGGDGIQLGNDGILSRCTATDNGGNEILGGMGVILEDCVADGGSGAGSGIQVGERSVVRGCSSSANETNGIEAGPYSLIESCIAFANGEDGVSLTGHSTVRECSATENQIGIVANGGYNRLEGNQANGNSYAGIQLGSGFGNVGVMNTSVDHFFVDCDDLGVGNLMEIRNVFDATNPWSNFCEDN
jgi:parallel beta-helix repeat protein